MTNPLLMTDAEIREAALDFYMMGNERAALLCIKDLMQRDLEGTLAWADEVLKG